VTSNKKIHRLSCILLLLFISIQSSAQLTANFYADVIAGCSPLVVNFHDQSTGGATNWQWNLGNGTLSQQQNPTGTYFTPGVYNVKLVIANANGSDSITRHQYITVYANPAVNFSVSDSIGCFPKTVQFTDKSIAGSGNIVQWTWDFGDGNISTQQHPVHTYTKAGFNTVTLKVVNSFGCQKVFTRQNIIQLQNTVANFSFSTNTGCQASTIISFNDLSTNAIFYQWSFGDGATSLLQSPSHIYPAGGTYNVKLITRNNIGCLDSVTKIITVGSTVADFSYSLACAGAPISFQNISSPSAISAEWNFGDGSTSTDLNPVKTFAVAGNYSVRLISDFGGCKDTVIKTVIVHPKPVAVFVESGSTSRCAAPAVVNFNASAGLNYQWSFGDGSTSTSKTPSHTYLSNGVYDVSLIVTNTGGCTDTLIKTGLVKIVPPQIVSLTGVPYLGCTPYTANLSAIINSPDPVVNWLWHFGDGTTSTLPTPSHVYSSPGSYDVKLVITTAGGCKDSISYAAAIQISNKPVANFFAAPLAVCAAGQVQFTDQSTRANEWLWIFGDGGFSIEQNPVHQFGDTGYFSVTLIASSTGCRDTFEIVNYVRNDPPIGRYNIVQSCDEPYKIQFRDSSIGGQTYKWFFGDGDSSSSQHPLHIYNAPGTYTFTFTVYHGSCSYPTSGVIRIVDEHPVLTSSDTAICKNVSVNFSAQNINTANIASYSWDFGDGNIVTTTDASVSHQYAVTGTYLARLITTNILGCYDTTQSIIISVYGPTAGFSNAEGTCINTNITFVDSSKTDSKHSIVQWEWSSGDGNFYKNNTSVFTHPYSNAGVYDVQLKVKDSFGCLDSVFKLSAVLITDPVANFILADTIKCSANTVSFTDQSNGLELTYQWNFGDGSQSAGQAASHSYNSEGIYTVHLKVFDRFGCTDSTSKQQVISDPVAKFNASDSFSTCPPLLVNLTNTSNNYSNLSWNFGDGSTADLSNPSHYYTYPGTYQLKLIATGFGNCQDSVYKTIIVKGPTGSFTFLPAAICANDNVVFNVTSFNSSKYLWDFSDGITTTTTTTSISHMYDVPGYYIPKLILIDTAGCEVPIVSPDTLIVKGVQARIGLTNHLFCDSAAIQFTDSSIINNDLPSQYLWSFGDGSFSNQNNPLHIYNTAGSYIVKLKITTIEGCVDSTITESPITIVNSPQISINNNSAICINDSIQFNATVIQPGDSTLNWNWDFGNGRTSSSQNPLELFNSEGSFVVKATATNTSGCFDTAVTTILVHPLPNVKAGTDTMICRGQTYTLQPTGAITYEWQNHPTLNVNGSSAMATPLFNTTYYLKGISLYGCVATDSVTINVVQPSIVEVNQDDTLCEGNSLQLMANGAAKYNWYPSTGLSNAAISNPVANPASTTTYMVIGSDLMNCFTDTGYVKLSVFPIPQFNIIDNLLTIPAGSTATINTISSPDITNWKWHPSKDLSCADCPQPVVTAKDDIVYRAEVWNDGGCAATDKITISVICNDGNVFIPNTFSPNNDGMNDVFYPRGKGITSIKAMKIFNRWGDLVYEKNDFGANDVNAGWNGTYKGSKLTPDVYVYVVDVVCDNSTIFTLKGNVTLIR
jgi:gliding motility-associated-like protein